MFEALRYTLAADQWCSITEHRPALNSDVCICISSDTVLRPGPLVPAGFSVPTPALLQQGRCKDATGPGVCYTQQLMETIPA